MLNSVMTGNPAPSQALQFKGCMGGQPDSSRFGGLKAAATLKTQEGLQNARLRLEGLGQRLNVIG